MSRANLSVLQTSPTKTLALSFSEPNGATSVTR